MGQDCNQRLLAPVYPLVEPESLQSGGSRRNTKVCIVVVLIPPRVWYKKISQVALRSYL